ncbi:MAG: LysM peptidoglycan-binding domain-containing protein [Candidatus Omnitrophica bacterium]|nr:LysM peptidoglycan-binding domain-containing protein [Candidatus Omnitrophota bacterium]
MRKMCVLIGVIALTGCTVRTYTVEKPRPDREVRGNQGFLAGSSEKGTSEKSARLGETRKIAVMELEFGSSRKVDAAKPVSKDGPDDTIELDRDERDVPGDLDTREVVIPEEMVSADPEYEIYTVQKNDTLQKISMKFYGTTKKWMKIYDANKDLLKSPDQIYPGKNIRVPLD